MLLVLEIGILDGEMAQLCAKEQCSSRGDEFGSKIPCQELTAFYNFYKFRGSDILASEGTCTYTYTAGAHTLT